MDLQLMDYRNSSKCASALCFVFPNAVSSPRTRRHKFKGCRHTVFVHYLCLGVSQHGS